MASVSSAMCKLTFVNSVSSVRILPRMGGNNGRARTPGHSPRRPRGRRGASSDGDGHSESAYSLAQRLSRTGDIARARAVLHSETVSTPSDARTWLALAQLEARGSSRRARETFRAGVEACPRSAHLLHAWAVHEGREGNYDMARKLFSRVFTIRPDDGVAWQALALMEERSGDIPAARIAFARGVEAGADDVHLWSGRGMLEMRQKEWDAAEKCFARAAELDGSHVRTLQAWALCAERLGKSGQSATLFSRALEADPRSVPTLQAYGAFEARRGRLSEARDLFRRASRIDPSHAPVWHAWASMERRVGNFTAARRLFDKGVKAAPQSTSMLRSWAAMETKLGHIDGSADWAVPGSTGKGRRRPRRPHLVEKKHGGQAEGISEKREKQILNVGENLRMLRLLIERRSDEDLRTVMKWLDRRAKSDRRLYDTLAERSESDAKMLRNWLERRSEADIAAFKSWLESRYERDRRIGVYIFNWDIPPISAKKRIRGEKVPAPIVATVEKPQEVPPEWYRLAEIPDRSRRAWDDLYYDGNSVDYAPGVHFFGQVAANLADRVALIFVLGSLSIILAGFAVHLEELGYSPAGEAAQGSGKIREIPPPSGVDAFLYEEGGADRVVTEAQQKVKTARRRH